MSKGVRFLSNQTQNINTHLDLQVQLQMQDLYDVAA